jgi:hypothetical protein
MRLGRLAKLPQPWLLGPYATETARAERRYVEDMKRRAFFAALFGAPVVAQAQQFSLPPITVNVGPCMDVPATRMSPTVWAFDFTPSAVAVYLNGVRQKKDLDYILIGSSVIVPSAQLDDVLVFDAT